MDTFIITGANTEPAQSIARRLCEIGARVYGIAGTFPENTFKHDEFFPIACDITNTSAIAAETEKILAAEHNLCGLILATQFLETDEFETLPAEEISLSVNALISTPLVITRLALPSLISSRGNIIAISPNTVTPRGHVLNNIMETAMKTFTGTLFGELRDTGVRTCHILLQNNPGAQDPATQFTNAPQSRIHADIVADTVETVLKLRENNALTQIVLRPQATRETPHIPVSAEPKIRTLQVVQLPPAKNFPQEEKSIYTEKYRRPDYAPKVAKDDTLQDDDDEDGLADDYVDPELRYLLKQPNQNNGNRGNTENSQRDRNQNWQNRPQQNQQQNPQQNSKQNQRFPQQNPQGGNASGQPFPQQQPQQFDENGNPISRKRKRHRNRNRNRNKNRDGNQNGGMHVRPPEVFAKNEEWTSQPREQKSLENLVPAPQPAPQIARENTVPAEIPAEKFSAPASVPATVPATVPAEIQADAPKPTSKPSVPADKPKAKRKPRTQKPKGPKTEDSSVPEKKASEEKPKKPRKPRSKKTAPAAKTDNAVEG